LISKGHPLGATGLAQCCELIWQLRGMQIRHLYLASSKLMQSVSRLGQQPPRRRRRRSPA
jgi:acetyl-CoA acetyltransferase